MEIESCFDPMTPCEDWNLADEATVNGGKWKWHNEMKKKKSDCSKNATFWFCQSWKDYRDLVQGWQAACLSTSQQVIRWASAWLTSRKLRPLHLMTSLSSWYDLLILWPVKCEWLSYRVRHGNTILRWLIPLKQKNLKRRIVIVFTLRLSSFKVASLWKEASP